MVNNAGTSQRAPIADIELNALRGDMDLKVGAALRIVQLALPAGAVLVFTMSTSAYVTPVLLGGTQTKVMASEIYDLAISYLEWKEAAVVAAILFAVVWIVVAGISRLMAGPGQRTRPA